MKNPQFPGDKRGSILFGEKCLITDDLHTGFGIPTNRNDYFFPELFNISKTGDLVLVNGDFGAEL